MVETMGKLKRTNYCTEVSSDDIGKQVVVAGFVQRQRDKGNLIFVDLRDRTGIIQLTFDDTTNREVFEKAKLLKSEYVLIAKGEVTARESVNTEIKTGNIEIFVSELRILAESQTPPFHINSSAKVNDELTLKYRYLDLRRAELQKNMITRHHIARVTREYFYENGFYELETPMLMKSTPEGARDYLVPSRLHKGKFYALPQSPQIYKQLFMIAGYDRYIQLARCFRDEDLRADRQPEFTQVDLEMSFVDVEDILLMVEGYISRLFSEVLGVQVPTPLPRLTYAQAMARYGSDKPDTRYAMELCDITEIAKTLQFPVFTGAIEEGGKVCAIVAKNAAATLTRKEIDRLVEYVKGIGAKGMAYVRFMDDAPACTFSKFLREGELDTLLTAVDCQKGDVAFFVADKHAQTILGSLRQTVAKQLDIIPAGYNFLWVTEFPFFEFDDESNTYVAMHHPFTMPLDECIDMLDENKGEVKAKAYDLVLNGTELSSGSIRITNYELQQKMFRALGLTDEEIEAKFGFLVNAYRYGSPPHGGMGIGLDRIAMIMCGADSLRDVVAFPKVQNASELMSDSPATVDQKQLDELYIREV